MLEGLFESKYDKILSIIKDKEINQILEMEENINDSRIDVELSDEFRKIEGILSSFKSNYNSLLSYKNCKSSKIDKTTFKDFYSLLYKSINEKESKESILNLLRNILNFEYGNCLLGNIPSFIQGCLDYIINYIVEIDKDNLILWPNYKKQKLSSLLCLYQNQN